MKIPDAASLRRKTFSRRRFLQLASGAVAGAAAGSWHSLLFSPTNPVINREEVVLKGLAPQFGGLKIVHLSDLHYSSLVSEAYLAKCVGIANALEPDLIFLTGDFVTRDELSRAETMQRFVEPLPRILSPLKARIGRFAVLGNHDVAVNSWGVSRALSDSDFHVLRDERVALTRGGDRLPLVGLRDFGTERVNLKRAFAGIDPDEPSLIMMHNPDLFEVGMDHRNGLIFSGHLHGGQIRFPFVGPIYVPSRFGAKYLSGRFQRDELCMLVNRGLGVIHFRIRLNCRPEITLVTLRAG